jgi:hypothetical protein
MHIAISLPILIFSVTLVLAAELDLIELPVSIMALAVLNGYLTLKESIDWFVRRKEKQDSVDDPR